jgi:diacylglycerol kinase (ATP)
MAREGIKRILVVGGDGTVHEVANGILEVGGSMPALAVAPVGTGNDFYRILGTPARLEAALALLDHGRIQWLDVGRALTDRGATHFVNLLGVGLDVEVLRRRSRFRRLSGLPQYLACLIATLVTFRGFSVEVSFESEAERVAGPTILAGITLGPSIGGGFLINPDASPEDGLLDFFFVEPLGPWQVARYIPRVIRGTHRGIPEFHFRKVTNARFLRSDREPFFFELDGELIPNPVTELNVEVLPRSLPVVLPPATP